MSHHARQLRCLSLAAGTAALALVSGRAPAQESSPAPGPDPEPVLTVDGRVALHSLVSLADGHLRTTADLLALVAGTEAVRSGDWERVREPLAEAARRSVPAVHWFALPDGRYWTLEQGRAAGTLSDRPYFPRVVDGETVIGELVVSRSSRRNTAIVAVPVRRAGGPVVGVLGSSVHLDSLSRQVRQEMGGLEDGALFYAIDDRPLGALHSDPEMIFTEPMELGDEGMRRAFTEMLAGEEGVVSYEFRGSERTVLYRRSAVTGWWYGFGRTEGGS